MQIFESLMTVRQEENKIKRPLFWVACAFLFGETGAMAGSRWYIWAAIIFAALFGMQINRHRSVRGGSVKRKTVGIWLIFVLVGIGGYCNMTSLRTQENFAKCAVGASCEVSGIVYDRQETTSGWMVQILAKEVVVKGEEAKEVEDTKEGENTKKVEDAKGVEKVENKIAFSGQMKIVVYLLTAEKPILGQDVVMSGIAALPEHTTNPGGFDAADYYKAKRIFMLLKDASYMESGVENSVLLNILHGIKERVASLYDQIFEPEDASILSAIVLGDKRGLDRDARNMYQLNGIAHILAISGLHIAILGMTLFEWIRKRTGSYRIAGCVAMTVVVFYGIMTGLSGSTSRAVIMMGLVMLGKVKGRSVDLLTSAGIASICMAAWNPYVILDAGFQLSFAAVAGLAVIHPLYVQLFGKKGKLKQALGVSMSSFLATLPICVFYYYQFPLYGIFLNLLVVPLVSWVLMSALVTAGCGVISIKAAEFTGMPAHFILVLYERLCSLFEMIPCSSINVGHISVRMVLVYYLGLGMILFILKCYVREKDAHQRKDVGQKKAENNSAGREADKLMRNNLAGRKLAKPMTNNSSDKGLAKPVRNNSSGRDLTKPVRNKSGRRGRYLYGIILVILLTALYEYANLDRSFVTAFLDVGQGDGILIRTEQGTSILIDGGSTSNQKVGEYVLLPAIRYYGMAELDYVFVTHGDADHVSGIEYLLNTEHIGIRIRNLVLAKYGDRQDLSDIETLAREKDINVIYMEEGDKIMEKQDSDMAGLTLKCLYPSGEILEEKKTDKSEDDGTMEYKKTETGLKDKIAEAGLKDEIIENFPEEVALKDAITESGLNANELSLVLLAEYDSLLSETDVLKVGHHGSRSASSEDFLQSVKPQCAIISCGKKNKAPSRLIQFNYRCSVELA